MTTINKFINTFHATTASSRYSLDDFMMANYPHDSSHPDFKYFKKLNRAYNRLKAKLCGAKGCCCWGFTKEQK